MPPSTNFVFLDRIKLKSLIGFRTQKNKENGSKT